MDGSIKSWLQGLQEREYVVMNDWRLAGQAETLGLHEFHARGNLQNSYLSANCMTRGWVSRPV
jgi:hypothetical protein